MTDAELADLFHRWWQGEIRFRDLVCATRGDDPTGDRLLATARRHRRMTLILVAVPILPMALCLWAASRGYPDAAFPVAMICAGQAVWTGVGASIRSLRCMAEVRSYFAELEEDRTA
jgi:hypothetical protein